MAAISLVKSALKIALNRLGYRLERTGPQYPDFLLRRRLIDPAGVEVLADADFQRSYREIEGLTLLDLPRLGNLWQLARASSPDGALIEVGCYKGGGALHISNACPDRAIVVCDSFAGFQDLDPLLDSNFSITEFRDASEQAVRRLFTSRGRNATVLAGFFPASAAGVTLPRFSFAHLDVDTYKGTIETLEFLDPLFLPDAMVVLDDCNRRAAGVDQAVREFVGRHAEWRLVPLFPAQGLLVRLGREDSEREGAVGHSTGHDAATRPGASEPGLP